MRDAFNNEYIYRDIYRDIGILGIMNIGIMNAFIDVGITTPYGQQRFKKKMLVAKRSLGYSKTYFINNIFFAN